MGLSNLATTQQADIAKAKVAVADDSAAVSRMMSDAQRIFKAVRAASTVRGLAMHAHMPCFSVCLLSVAPFWGKESDGKQRVPSDAWFRRMSRICPSQTSRICTALGPR